MHKTLCVNKHEELFGGEGVCVKIPQEEGPPAGPSPHMKYGPPKTELMNKESEIDFRRQKKGLLKQPPGGRFWTFQLRLNFLYTTGLEKVAHVTLEVSYSTLHLEVT